MKEFYVGIQNVQHIPLVPKFFMLSVNRLFKRKSSFHTYDKIWILDSGGFSILHKMGKYSYSVEQYIEIINKFRPNYFIIMDWMCEPSCLAKTKKTVNEHIELTIQNHIEMKEKYNGESELIGVIQGWNVEDYLYCIDLLKTYGLIEDRMAIGTLCKRQKTKEIIKILERIKKELPAWCKLHGLGVKLSFLKRGLYYSNLLYSADSMAWTVYARRLGVRLVDEKNNCLIYEIPCLSRSDECSACGYFMRWWTLKIQDIINKYEQTKLIIDYM